MIVTPLDPVSRRAVPSFLAAHGWDPGMAAASGGGLEPLAFRITGLPADTARELVRYCGKAGLDLLTGDGWALLAGPRARLSAFARPWLVAPELSELAMLVGLAMPAPPEAPWLTAGAPVALDRPVILGILNVTPDSFSDGGRHATVDAALRRAAELVEQGAHILDVGGESTRPGRSAAVEEHEECERVLPVIETLARALPGVPLSIDTVKSGVARAALDAGATIINDVSGFRLDPQMADVAAASRAGVILMHSRGGLLELSSYAHAEYEGNVVGGVIAELRAAVEGAVARGVAPDAIVVDPGLGFAKTPEQSLELLDQLRAVGALGRPVLVGPSRKRFLGAATGLDLADRDRVLGAACALAWERGARLFRVHDVGLARDALALAQALSGP